MLNWMIVVNLTRILASSLLFITIATEHKYISIYLAIWPILRK